MAFKSVENTDLHFPCSQRCFPMTILTTNTRKVCRLLPEVAAVSVLCCQLSFLSQALQESLCSHGITTPG